MASPRFATCACNWCTFGSAREQRRILCLFRWRIRFCCVQAECRCTLVAGARQARSAEVRQAVWESAPGRGWCGSVTAVCQSVWQTDPLLPRTLTKQLSYNVFLCRIRVFCQNTREVSRRVSMAVKLTVTVVCLFVAGILLTASLHATRRRWTHATGRRWTRGRGCRPGMPCLKRATVFGPRGVRAGASNLTVAVTHFWSIPSSAWAADTISEWIRCPACPAVHRLEPLA